jgi:predicted CopG family antitoxin
MRTTITIPDHLAEHIKMVTGKKRLSEAIAEMAEQDRRTRSQLAALQFLRENKPDVTWKQIKAARRRNKWSA